MLGRVVASCLLAGVLSAATAPSLRAQNEDAATVSSPVLVVASDRLYSESAFGRRVAAEFVQASEQLANENRSIEAELEAEEKALTEQRASLSPEEFRGLADAFDDKVQLIRREQEAKARALVQRRDDSRGAFLTAALPILERIMRDAGAAVILERRSVFLSLRAIDITDVALSRIDAEIADGRDLRGAE